MRQAELPYTIYYWEGMEQGTVMKRLWACLFLCAWVTSTLHSEPLRTMQVDSEGVLRYEDNGEEVALFGVNYYPPFSMDYRRLKLLGIDHKSVIRQDVNHFKRLGLSTLRLHCFEREFCDGEGNFLDNEHIELLDYLIAECSQNGIYVVLTPIAWWGTQQQVKGCFPSRYATIEEMLSDHHAWDCMARFLEQFGKHVNRYTGLRYADDPAIPVFELINEPIFKKDTPEEEMVAFANALAEGLRKSGTRKPIFFSAWLGKEHIVAQANVEGATHGWYPGGLHNARAIQENLLPKLDRFQREFLEPCLDKKAKMIYEFDAANVSQTCVFPAMARAFRHAGVQIACQFQYDPMVLADCNANWRIHYLNLVYTPGKAMGFAIAAEVFKKIPRGYDAGTYPDNSRFGPFRVSYEEDLSECVTETEFLYANDTATRPPRPEALQRVWGVGSSCVADYGGNGAYFLDRTGDGEWLLEIYPDIVQIQDPYASNKGEKVRMLPGENDLTLSLPDLGMDYVLVREESGAAVAQESRVIQAVEGRVHVPWGRYRAYRSREKMAEAQNVETGRPFVPENVPVPQETAFMQMDYPFFQKCRNDLHVNAFGYTEKNCDRLELCIAPEGSAEEALHVPLLKKRHANQYEATVPGAWLDKAGSYRLWIEHEAEGRVRVFPEEHVVQGIRPKDGQTWPAFAASAEVPLPKDVKEEGCHPTYRYVPEEQCIQMTAEKFEGRSSACAIRLKLQEPPVGVPVTALRLLMRGFPNTNAVEIGLVHDDKHAYGKSNILMPDWQELEVNLNELGMLWDTVEGKADAHQAAFLNLVTGRWLFPSRAHLPHGLEIRRAEWVFHSQECHVFVEEEDAAPVLLDFEKGLAIGEWGEDAVSRLTTGMEPYRRAWQWVASSFEGSKNHVSKNFRASPLFKSMLRTDKKYGCLVMTARAVGDATTQIEVAFQERDGSVWGMNVDLTTAWRKIRIPVSQPYLFSHWTEMPKGRGGEGDHLNPQEISGIYFCLGKFLFPDTWRNPHGVVIQDIRLEE